MLFNDPNVLRSGEAFSRALLDVVHEYHPPQLEKELLEVKVGLDTLLSQILHCEEGKTETPYGLDSTVIRNRIETFDRTCALMQIILPSSVITTPV